MLQGITKTPFPHEAVREFVFLLIFSERIRTDESLCDLLSQQFRQVDLLVKLVCEATHAFANEVLAANRAWNSKQSANMFGTVIIKDAA